MDNDPSNMKKYEKDLWKLHIHITELKDAYYAEKEDTTPKIKNVHITFRSMEGRRRVMQAYETSNVVRILVGKVCALESLFAKKKFL